MSIFTDALKLKIEELEAQRTAIFDQMKPLQDKNSSLCSEIESLTSKLKCLEREEAAALPEDQQIPFYLENDGRSKGMEHYYAKQKFWEAMGFGTSGYYPATNQDCLQISLNNDKSQNDHTVDIIRRVLPHILPVTGIDDTRPDTAMKGFRIFEHTCSEYGSYSLFYDESEELWILSIISWHRRRDVFTTNSLEEVIDYISINHPYEIDGYDYEGD